MQNVHPRATMGWPHWAKEGLEMISQQVSSYSATNVTHTPIQVIRGSTWRLKQRKPTEMDNSRINHLTISTPILSSHLQLLCFPFRARSTGHWSFSKIVSQPFKSDCGFVTSFDNKQPIISEVLTTVTLGGEGLSGAVAALSASAL